MSAMKEELYNQQEFANKELEAIEPDPSFIVDRSKSGRGRYNLDGKPLTGVTTIVNMQAKGFLTTWAASEAYKEFLSFLEDPAYTNTALVTKVKAIIKDKNWAHDRKSGNAKDKGTAAHDYVERFVKNYIKTKQYTREVIADDEVKTSVDRFYDWAEKEQVEFLGSEVSVYSRKHWYAGSFDFICKIKGKILLGDFKTSKQIDDTYFAQGAGYIIAVEETQPRFKFDGIVIVRSILAKEGQVWYEKSSVPGKAKKMQALAWEVEYRFDLEREKTYFLSLLNIYRYSKKLEIGRWYEAEMVDYNEEDYPVNG